MKLNEHAGIGDMENPGHVLVTCPSGFPLGTESQGHVFDARGN